MILIKKARIIEPESSWHNRVVDILVHKGVFLDIGKNIQNAKAKTIEGGNLHVSIGWLDVGTQVGEPGYEHREDLESVSAAAAAGGYTALACFPNTNPVVHSKSEVNFLVKHTGLTDFFPIGALSRDCKGKDLAELYDMAAVGAIAFSDGSHAIASAGLMKRGLEYLKGINGLIINMPMEDSLAKDGQMHEGEMSTQLGMKGIPVLAETLMLKRDIALLEYTNSRLHVHNISSAAAMRLVKAAKRKGLKITASVAAMNLVANDSSLKDFDANYKVNPPLRAKSDSHALLKGIEDGTIDFISTNHQPLEAEAKNLEFLYADFGCIGLETTYALLNTQLKERWGQEDLVNVLAIQPRKVLGLPIPKIEKLAKTNISVFDPNKSWTLTKRDIFSKSKNTPYLNTTFQGKVKGVINGVYTNL